MPSNEGHIHWPGPGDENITYLNQPLVITVNEVPGDPLGTLRIRHESHVGVGPSLPNSSTSLPAWDGIPGTSPMLEVRQDGSYPVDYIRIRQA